MIYVEDQAVKVDGVILPGLLKSIEVKETALIDAQQVEGSAAKPKQATGYEDAKVNIELILDDTPTQTKYQRLAVVRSIFRKAGQAVPQPIPIVSEDTAAHGVEKVLFSGISHKAENKRGQLPVTLEFLEYIPQTITAKKGDTTAPTTPTSLTSRYSSYLTGDRGKSPAVDNASPVKWIGKIRALPY